MQVWGASDADGGWYNMWADHPMLPKLGLYETASDCNLHDSLSSWEPQAHAGHVSATSGM